MIVQELLDAAGYHVQDLPTHNLIADIFFNIGEYILIEVRIINVCYTRLWGLTEVAGVYNTPSHMAR